MLDPTAKKKTKTGFNLEATPAHGPPSDSPAAEATNGAPTAEETSSLTGPQRGCQGVQVRFIVYHITTVSTHYFPQPLSGHILKYCLR